jgi:hypothetical protein
MISHPCGQRREREKDPKQSRTFVDGLGLKHEWRLEAHSDLLAEAVETY